MMIERTNFTKLRAVISWYGFVKHFRDTTIEVVSKPQAVFKEVQPRYRTICFLTPDMLLYGDRLGKVGEICYFSQIDLLDMPKTVWFEADDSIKP